MKEKTHNLSYDEIPQHSFGSERYSINDDIFDDGLKLMPLSLLKKRAKETKKCHELSEKLRHLYKVQLFILFLQIVVLASSFIGARMILKSLESFIR